MTNNFTLGNLEITWFGHASFKIKSDNFVIYLDPFKIQVGEKADLILITHSHFDHKDEDSIKLLSKTSTEVLIGGENIKEGDFKEIKDVKIKAVPAYNLTKPFHPRGKGCGFIIEIDGKRIYHAGDTDVIPEMSEFGEINLALLPIGGTYTMDINEAAKAIEILKPKKVFPMHYNTFPEIKIDVEKFKELIDKNKTV